MSYQKYNETKKFFETGKKNKCSYFQLVQSKSKDPVTKTLFEESVREEVGRPSIMSFILIGQLKKRP